MNVIDDRFVIESITTPDHERTIMSQIYRNIFAFYADTLNQGSSSMAEKNRTTCLR
jgi:hypothetical protein